MFCTDFLKNHRQVLTQKRFWQGKEKCSMLDSIEQGSPAFVWRNKRSTTISEASKSSKIPEEPPKSSANNSEIKRNNPRKNIAEPLSPTNGTSINFNAWRSKHKDKINKSLFYFFKKIEGKSERYFLKIKTGRIHFRHRYVN